MRPAALRGYESPWHPETVDQDTVRPRTPVAIAPPTTAPRAPAARASTEYEQHGLFKSILLHVAPGLIMLAGYLAIAPLTRALQLPGRATFVLANVLFLVPALLLPLYLLGRQRTGRWTLEGIVRYRRLVSLGSLGLAFLGIAMWVVFVTASLSWVDDWMLAHAFAWLPQSIVAGSTLDLSGYGAVALVSARLFGVVVVGLLGPLAEEVYFRGYLLPRIGWMGAWAVPFQATLYAGYHFLSPWAFVTRFLIMVPAIHFVQRTRSIWLLVVGHTLVSLAGEILALLTVLNAVGW